MPQILLIEDDDTIGISTKEYLEEIYDHQVSWLTRGDEAQTALSESHNFDCIILDLSLPGADGIDVLQTLRTWDTTTPVIIVSAHDFPDIRKQCFAAGATDFQGKPVWLNTLNERIEACLAKAE